MRDSMVLCDANLFYSILMTDLLLSLGEAGFFRPRWTKEIHEEWIRNVLADQPARRREDLDRRRALMDQAIDDDLIENYERHIENLVLPDPADRHVLAAAIEGGAEIILTYNLRDFPTTTLTAYGISALHPDEFLCRHMKEEPALVMEVIEKMRLKRSRPEISQEQLLNKLARLTLPNFVEMLRQASSSV